MAAITVGILVSLGGPTTTTAATATPPRSRAQTAPPLAANGREAPHLDPVLAHVKVEGAAYEQAQATFDQIGATLAADRLAQREAVAALVRLRAHAAQLDRFIRRDTAIATAAKARIALLEHRVRSLALDAYMGVGSDDTEVAAASNLDSPALRRAQTKNVLRRVVTRSSATELGERQGTLDRARARLVRNRADLARTRADVAANVQRRDSSRDAAIRDRAQMLVDRADLAEARATADVAGTDLPLVALDAYRHAVDLAEARTPGCGIQWTLLAGIGDVESRQGTYSGGAMDPLGHIAVPIYGPLLDGTHGNKKIPDTDHGALDGTTKGDRAVGPMQFIPSTWAAVATDGDGDGTADPADIYDAAATAARYLCRQGPGLDTEGGRTRAILSYNDSGAYVADVTRAADRYATLVKLPTAATTPSGGKHGT